MRVKRCLSIAPDKSNAALIAVNRNADLLVAFGEPQDVLPRAWRRKIGIPKKAGIFDQSLPSVNKTSCAGNISSSHDRVVESINADRVVTLQFSEFNLQQLDVCCIAHQLARLRAPQFQASPALCVVVPPGISAHHGRQTEDKDND